MTRVIAICLLTAAVVAGCSKPEILDPIDGTVPANVDLSGTWQIRSDLADEQRRLQAAIRKTDGVRDSTLRSEPVSSELSRASQRPGKFKGGLVDVFLETGSILKVTQTDHALFISFDRSVVEEFRFGENRIVSVGQVQAQRVTGWEGSTLVVETLDKNRMKLTERFSLLDAGGTLQREITFRSKQLEEVTIVQAFTRTN